MPSPGRGRLTGRACGAPNGGVAMRGASGRRLAAGGLLALLLLAGCAERPVSPAAAPAATGEPRMTLLQGGTELSLEGRITFAASARLDELLAAHPIRLVQLTGNGGFLKPALEMAEALWRHEVVTFVPGRCTSGCTLLFLAGTTRFLAPGAVLGFHRTAPHQPLPAGTQVLYDDADMAAWMELRGVAPGFVARVLATPAAELWVPSVAELRAAGVIDAVLSRQQLPRFR